MNFFNNLTLYCYAPKPWGPYFQYSDSPQIEALIQLHDNIMFYLAIILFGVAWIMVSIIRNYVSNKAPISNKYLNHGTLIELIWTITPALILILIAFPSFKLLYLMDEVTDYSLTVFIEEDKWYWSYEYPIYNSDDELEYYSSSNISSPLNVNNDRLYINYILDPPITVVNLDLETIANRTVQSWDTNRCTYNNGDLYKYLSHDTAQGNFTQVNGVSKRTHIAQYNGEVYVSLDTGFMERNNIHFHFRGTRIHPVNIGPTGFGKYILPR